LGDAPKNRMTQTSKSECREFLALAETLRERLAVIADREWFNRDPAGHLEALKSVSERIERVVSALPAPVDSQLSHYLERRSYDKALAFLSGEPQQAGRH
jgi:hypothetical protein